MGFFNGIDFFRKIPQDLTEATVAGGGISLLGSFIMAYLFVSNLSEYLTVTQSTSIVLDKGNDQKLQINFNITMHHLPCRYASLDIVDVMGTHLMNLTKNVHKERLNAEGKRMGKSAPEQREIVHGEKLASHDDEVPKHSLELDSSNFDDTIRSFDLVLVNFYAPWCPWSQRMAPVWEEASSHLGETWYGHVVRLAKVDCTSHEAHHLCHEHHVHAFPTVRVYRDKNIHSHENYVGDRTHQALRSFVESNLPEHVTGAKRQVNRETVETGISGPEGCEIRGALLVNRVPGNFHISAHSKSHSFNIQKMNLSHHVETLSFGQDLRRPQLKRLPKEVSAGWNVLANTDFVSNDENVTQEHYIKVVHTTFNLMHGKLIDTYQYTVNHNNYQDGASMPAAVFSYDISPMQVIVTASRESLATFLTQLCAIIGGVFTVTGLVDSTVYHGHNAIKKKMEIGKAI